MKYNTIFSGTHVELKSSGGSWYDTIEIQSRYSKPDLLNMIITSQENSQGEYSITKAGPKKEVIISIDKKLVGDMIKALVDYYNSLPESNSNG